MLPRGCKTLSSHENPLRGCASALLLTKGEGGRPAATYSNHLTRGIQLCVDLGLAKTWQPLKKKKVLHLIKIKSNPPQYNQMTHGHQFEILNYFNLINDSSLTVKKGLETAATMMSTVWPPTALWSHPLRGLDRPWIPQGYQQPRLTEHHLMYPDNHLWGRVLLSVPFCN